MSAALDRLAALLVAAGKKVVRRGDAIAFQCPVHDDQNPSAGARAGNRVPVVGGCLACGVSARLPVMLDALCASAEDRDVILGSKRGQAVAQLRGWTGGCAAPTRAATTPDGKKRARRTPSATAATVQPLAHPGGCTLAALADAKRLPEAFLREQGLRDTKYRRVPAVRIPYRDEAGTEMAVHFRLRLAGTGDERFRWRSGSKARPFGLWRSELQTAPAVALVEGETDALTLWHHGIAALALPGAASAHEEAENALAHTPLVLVVIEPDSGGESLKAWLAKSPLRDRARIVALSAKDVSDLHVEDPGRFRERWDAAVVDAIPVTDVLALEAAELKRVAWLRCGELAKAPRILDRVGEALLDVGLVGEQRAAKLLYLAVVSRLFERPLSITVKGPSSAGKSFLVDCVLKLFPGTAYYALTAMSDRALAYSDEPLVHRVLVLYEAAGIGGEHMPYMLRSLLSEGCIRYETVEKSAKGMRARTIDRPGPTGLIATTTALRLDPELETRLLSVPVTDTAEQTGDVLVALAGDRSPSPDLEPWHALQVWLELANQVVVVPFAKRLAALVPPCAVRLRRDFRAVLSLVQAHALLHQATRARDEQGRVVAVLGDYTVVRELVVDLVSAGVQATVPPTVRETVSAVIALNSGDQGVTGKAVATRLRLDKGTTSRRLRQAADLEYVRNREDRNGLPARWVPGDPLPDDLEILPQPDRLTGNPAVDGEVSELDASTALPSVQVPETVGFPDIEEQAAACEALGLRSSDPETWSVALRRALREDLRARLDSRNREEATEDELSRE